MLNDSNVFITYSNDMDEVMKTLENTIQIRHEIIIIFDVMITDLFSNKKKLTNSNSTIKGNKGKKRNISLVFITQSYFLVSKTIKLNSTQCFIIKI